MPSYGDLNVNQRSVVLRKGAKGTYLGQAVEIKGILGPNKILIFDIVAKTTQIVTLDKFEPSLESKTVAAPSAIHDESTDWDTADRRFEIIEPLVNRPDGAPRVTSAEVKERAAIAGRHYTTIYRWKSIYENGGEVPSTLKPKFKSRGGRGHKLDTVMEAIVTATINDLYKDRQQRTIKSTYRGLLERCRAAGLTAPCYNTLRMRIAEIPKREQLESRSNKKLAADRYDLRPGSFQGDRPWQLIQIDGTPMDVILVDDKHGKPIGRAHLTCAIDTYSRMILGTYVSLEGESANTAGLCLSHAMLPKGPWLAKKGLSLEWPCSGRPIAIHADNGLAFQSKMLHRACREYKMTLEFRALKTPQYGGIIEAFNKTLARKIHELKGTTFFGIDHRAEYPSEKLAFMPLEHFEKWLCETIFEYHEEYHSKLQCSPRARYDEAYREDDEKLPLLKPEKITNEERLRIDFMPFDTRTIQSYGVQFWYVRYAHPILRRYVNATAGGKNAAKREFRFHYDPRDISRIYFYHPDLEQYFAIPYRNRSNPSMSSWECVFASKELEKEGRAKIDERAIIESVKRRRAIEADAAATSKSARRNVQRVASAKATSVPLAVVPSEATVTHRIIRPLIAQDI
jgi:putative transposase